MKELREAIIEIREGFKRVAEKLEAIEQMDQDGNNLGQAPKAKDCADCSSEPDCRHPTKKHMAQTCTMYQALIDADPESAPFVPHWERCPDCINRRDYL